MSSNCVLLEQHDSITVLRLNRPPANAFCLELAHEFEAALDSDAVANAAALVLTGAGPFFSGGLDLKSVPNYSREDQREFLGVLNRAIGKLYACPVPVVGAINGHAVAGGFIAVLATDYRVGPVGEARFGLTEARVGIPFPAVPMIILLAECAPQDVRFITLLARNFGAEEARKRGIFDEIQPPEAVLGRAIEVARDMASMPADGYRRIKYQVRESVLAKIEAVMETGADPMLADWFAPEVREASLAILKPTSTG
jgi:enoyl-CoA hydratase